MSYWYGGVYGPEYVVWRWLTMCQHVRAFPSAAKRNAWVRDTGGMRAGFTRRPLKADSRTVREWRARCNAEALATASGADETRCPA